MAHPSFTTIAANPFGRGIRLTSSPDSAEAGSLSLKLQSGAVMSHYNQNLSAALGGFAWNIPERFNIGFDICDRWACEEPTRIAIVEVDEAGTATPYSFDALARLSGRIANLLQDRGISGNTGEPGDRVGVFLPQCVETAAAHIAITKMGCISLPLFSLFEVEALRHRLRDSGAKAVITDASGSRKLLALKSELPELRCVFSIDGPDEGAECLRQACATQSESYTPMDTLSEDPAILIYTSGTTGQPKGALHAHRVLLGHLPGVEMSHNFLPHPGDKFWTPADWAWIGGLLDVLMPALHHGIPVVACRFSKFTGEAALELIRNQKIRNAFLPPTALKLMRLVPDAESYGLSLRSVASGGETLGGELIEWGRRVFRTTINEFYGQTECNMVVSSCSSLEPATPGIMGRPVPGHEVHVIDTASGKILPLGEEGSIAVLSPDPVMFLRYWNDPQSTEEKFMIGADGRWLLTGDRGVCGTDLKLRFRGRDDDVISSGGYRIGPGEIEDCLIGHPAVKLAGVVGKPDDIRGFVVAAYVTLSDGYRPSEELAQEITEFVKNRLAAHEYPRVVRFIDDMPMTATGKIIRAALRQAAEEEAEAESL